LACESVFDQKGFVLWLVSPRGAVYIWLVHDVKIKSIFHTFILTSDREKKRSDIPKLSETPPSRRRGGVLRVRFCFFYESF